MTQSLLIEIPAELFALAKSSSYAGEIEVDPFDFMSDSYVAARPFSWKVVVSNVGGAFLITGSVSGVLLTSCAHCLGEVSFDIQGEIEGYFLIEGDVSAPREAEEDDFDILPEDNRIDLEPLIMAAIFVELPIVAVCKKDCAGICSHCGANLNEERCKCSPSRPQQEDGIKPDNPFAALQDLKLV